MIAFFMMGILTVGLMIFGVGMWISHESRLASLEKSLDELGIDTPQAFQDMVTGAAAKSEEALRIARKVDSRT